MATSLTITTGALTTSLVTQDDTAAQLVLLRFAHAIGGQEGDPPQALLDRVAAHLADHMVRIARERYIMEESETIAQEAIENVHW